MGERCAAWRPRLAVISPGDSGTAAVGMLLTSFQKEGLGENTVVLPY